MSREASQVRNEVLFREVNQRIADLSETWPGDEFHIVCECATSSCGAMLPVSVEAYRRVRANPRMFFIAPGHDVPEIEDVVERHEAYHVVEKHSDVELHVWGSPPTS